MKTSTQRASRDAALADIALKHLEIANLETCHMATLDYHLVAVWNIQAALVAAYESGRDAAATSI